MNRIIATLCVLSVVLTLHAQRTVTDSTNIIIVDSLLDKAHIAMINVDIKKTIELSSEALELSIKEKYHLGSIRAYYTLGQGLFNDGKYKESLSYLSEAIKVKGHNNYPLYMSQIHKVMGQIFFYLDIRDDSIIKLNKALATANRIKNIEHKGYITSQIYESLSIVYGGIGDMEASLVYMKKNVDLLNSLDENFVYPNKINLFTSLGDYYINDGQVDSAKYYIDNSLNIIEKYNFVYTCRAFRYLGDIYKLQNDQALALESYYTAFNNADELGLKSEMRLLHRNIAEVFQKLNMPDSANVHIDKQMLMENESLREKLSTTDIALKELILQEKDMFANKRNKLFILYITITLVSILSIGLLLLKRKRKLLDEVEEETQELKQRLNEAFEEIMELAKSNDPAFIFRFQEVYPVFYNKLINKHTDLSPTDLRLCAMTYLNFSTIDIAEYTFVESRSVQARRSRLRKKINLPPDYDLLTYLKSLE